MSDELCDLSTRELHRAYHSGCLSPVEVAEAVLARIERQNPQFNAFASINPDVTIEMARRSEERWMRGVALGLGDGIPTTIKDLMQTRSWPTLCGSRTVRADQPWTTDTACVARLREAGAVFVGKTTTPEFGWKGLDGSAKHGPTRNPWDPRLTSGGSSAGSGVAAALGLGVWHAASDAAGSIRIPAAFCGVFGFKPTWGSISAEGAKLFSVTLDTVGWYARAIEDIGLLVTVYEISSAEEPSLAGLNLAWCETPYWNRATADGQDAFRATLDKVRAGGASMTELRMGDEFATVNDLKERVMRGEGRVAFLNLHHKAPDKVSPGIRARMGRTDDLLLRKALDDAAMLRIAFDTMAEPFDAVLTPAATGVAPEGLAYAGDPIFNGMWTLLHAPCLSMPVMSGEQGLPIGLQLVGPRYSDARVIAAGRRIVKMLGR